MVGDCQQWYVVHATTLQRLRQEECPRFETACPTQWTPVQPGLQSRIMSPKKTKQTQKGEGGWKVLGSQEHLLLLQRLQKDSQHPHGGSQQPMSTAQGCSAFFWLPGLMNTGVTDMLRRDSVQPAVDISSCSKWGAENTSSVKNRKTVPITIH